MAQIPMLDLKLEYEYMKEAIDAALKRCLEHQKWILGPEVGELETKVSEYLGGGNCIGVSSGTEALVLALRAMAISLTGNEYFDETDEIVTTPFTFTATGDAILRAGATPVFADVDPSTFNIDPAAIRAYLKSAGGRVRGIVPVHLYGRPCDMAELTAISEEYGLFILEDTAQAFGASYGGRKLGTLGAAGAFSFFPSKNLGGFGDGGMVYAAADETAELIRMLLKHGGKDKYNVEHIGYNARLDTIQAAVILAKLRYLDEFNEKRRKIAALYDEGLAGIDGLYLPATLKETGSRHVYHQYTIKTRKRNELQEYLKNQGVSTMVYYPFPLHKMSVFGADRCKVPGSLTNAEEACSSVLSLPVEPLQKDSVTETVVACVRGFFGR